VGFLNETRKEYAMARLLKPADAAQELGISTATITRCVKRGAPVHRWGSTGYRYRIDVAEFTVWMESQGAERGPDANRYTPDLKVEEMAARNRARLRAL
jgi:phage terminase Nu1 subunit (DNA packaging protein)